MVNTFDFSDITNGGANRFWVNDDGDYLIGGSDVDGRFQTNSFDDWLVEAAGLYGGSVKSLGTITGSADISSNQVNIQNNAIAKLSGAGIGGQYRFTFDSVEEATNFGDFLDAVTDTLI